MTEKPDFEALRQKRDEGIRQVLDKVAEKHGFDTVSHVNYGGGSIECYCACADGGPCEHEFAGWREFEDGSGGETFCQRCGMGSMSHTLNTCWD